MAALIDLVQSGRIASGSTVLYAHLGGQPALNAYAGPFRAAGGGKRASDESTDCSSANSRRFARRHPLPGRRFDHVFRPRHGIGPPQPNGVVVGGSGGTVSENGMDVSGEETSRARNALVA